MNWYVAGLDAASWISQKFGPAVMEPVGSIQNSSSLSPRDARTHLEEPLRVIDAVAGPGVLPFPDLDDLAHVIRLGLDVHESPWSFVPLLLVMTGWPRPFAVRSSVVRTWSACDFRR